MSCHRGKHNWIPNGKQQNPQGKHSSKNRDPLEPSGYSIFNQRGTPLGNRTSMRIVQRYCLTWLARVTAKTLRWMARIFLALKYHLKYYYLDPSKTVFIWLQWTIHCFFWSTWNPSCTIYRLLPSVHPSQMYTSREIIVNMSTLSRYLWLPTATPLQECRFPWSPTYSAHEHSHYTNHLGIILTFCQPTIWQDWIRDYFSCSQLLQVAELYVGLLKYADLAALRGT